MRTSATRKRVRELADGSRTVREIATIIGVDESRVRKIGTSEGMLFRTPSRRDHAAHEKQTAKLRELAAQGMGSREMAEVMGLGRKTVQNYCQRAGIQIQHVRPRQRDKPAPGPAQAQKVQSIEEWLSLHGKSRRFEPGTLDQIMADTYARAGKSLARCGGGTGASAKPYRLNGQQITMAQAIAGANKIRERERRPLLTAPRYHRERMEAAG